MCTARVLAILLHGDDRRVARAALLEQALGMTA